MKTIQSANWQRKLKTKLFEILLTKTVVQELRRNALPGCLVHTNIILHMCQQETYLKHS